MSNSWASFRGECQVFRTNLENQNIDREFSESGPGAQYIVVIPRARSFSLLFKSHSKCTFHKGPGDHFYMWINCLDSWKPACISVLLKWLCFCSWCLCLLHYQRQAKYSENKLKSIKARNEYLLTLEATNASVFKYYIHDLSDLIDVSTWWFIYRKYHSLMK